MTAVSPDAYSFRFGATVPGSGVVGTWPVLGDGDDSTYVVVAADFSIPNGDELDLTFPAAGSGSGSTSVTLRMRVDNGDDVSVNESRVQVDLSSATGDFHAVWLFSLPDPSLWYDHGLPLGTPQGGGAGSRVDYGADEWVIFQNKTSTDFDTDGTDSDDPFPGLLVELAAGTLVASITRPESAGGVDDAAHRNVQVSQFVLSVAPALPCDAPVALDLSEMSFLTDSPSAPTGQTGPYGQYGDGVIYPVADALGGGFDGFPDFFAAGLVTEAKPYRITLTFDPTSVHDEGTRQLWVSSLPAGGEQAAFAAGTWTFGDLFNGSGNTADSITFTVTPEAGQNFWFETDHGGAVSAVSIRKVCTTFAPPQRLTNRDDMFASARRITGSRSQQGSNLLTGYL